MPIELELPSFVGTSLDPCCSQFASTNSQAHHRLQTLLTCSTAASKGRSQYSAFGGRPWRPGPVTTVRWTALSVPTPKQASSCSSEPGYTRLLDCSGLRQLVNSISTRRCLRARQHDGIDGDAGQGGRGTFQEAMAPWAQLTRSWRPSTSMGVLDAVCAAAPPDRLPHRSRAPGSGGHSMCAREQGRPPPRASPVHAPGDTHAQRGRGVHAGRGVWQDVGVGAGGGGLHLHDVPRRLRRIKPHKGVALGAHNASVHHHSKLVEHLQHRPTCCKSTNTEAHAPHP